MLNDHYVREHSDAVRAGLRRRRAGAEAERTLDAWLALDTERRAMAARNDALARMADVPASQAGGTPHRSDPNRERERRKVAAALVALEAQARALLLRLPNLPDPRVPGGTGAPGNVELRRWGEPRDFSFTPRPHEELASALGILDLPHATKLAGTRFPLLLGTGARLGRALAALMPG